MKRERKRVLGIKRDRVIDRKRRERNKERNSE